MEMNVSDVIESLSEAFDLGNKALDFTNKILSLKKTTNKDKDEDEAVIKSSGDYAKIGSSGDYAKIGSSGDSAQIGSSGYYAKIGSSGYSAKIGSSGDYAQIGSSGDYAVISAIGYQSRVKAKKGSWITLAEYEKDDKGNWRVSFVKTEFVDGEKIKEDTEYMLYNKEFHEVIEADGITSIILRKKCNVYKVINLGEDKPSYLLCEDGIYSHGDTLQEAKDSLKYKISDRDTSKYEHYKQSDVVSVTEAIRMYRTIAGACEKGTRYFVENNNIDKKEYKISEIIKLTKGQYNSDKFEEFFRNRK